MNKEHVELNLTIFRALNPAVVVEKLWFERWRENRYCKIVRGISSGFVPDYAGDWAAMGALIEEMNKRGIRVAGMFQTIRNMEESFWDVRLSLYGKSPEATANTLPHAVALAAKRALEEAKDA